MNLEILDLGAACRLCLAVNSNHVPIFNESETDYLNPASLPQRIGDCVGLEMTESDELPSSVCSNCLQEVDRWFHFRTQCRNTNELLRKVLGGGYQILTAPLQEKTGSNASVEFVIQTDQPEVESQDELACELHSKFISENSAYTDSNSSVEIVYQTDQPELENTDEVPCEPGSKSIFQNSSGASTKCQSEDQIVRPNTNENKVSDLTENFENTNDSEDLNSDDFIDDSEDFCGDDDISGDINDDSHWRLKPVACPICFKSFSKHSGVKLHLRVVHTVLRVFPCFICANVSCLSNERIKHIEKKHPKATLKKNTCTICGIQIKTRSSFHRHLRKHASERRCELCNEELGSIEALEKHRRTAHQEKPPDGVDQSYYCHHCENVSFWKEADWRAHYLDIHNTEDVYPCELCDKAYRNKALLVAHLRIHTGEKPYMCAQCPTRFTSKQSLRNHMRKHTSRFECDICNKTYSSNASLFYHKRTHTGETPYVCHECGKLFKSIQGLQFHMRIHSGEKPYCCDKCDYSSRTASGLYSHKARHTEDRPFKCDECGKSFKMKAWLKEHKKTHSGVKNFVCEFCDHAFVASYQLKSHMKTHTGERSHVCEFCSKSFARRDTLSEHLRTHTKEKKYTCQDCNIEFTFLKQLKKHKCRNSTLESVPELTVSSCYGD